MSDMFDTVLRTDDTPMTQDELAAAIADCDVFVPTVTDQIDAAVLSHASPRLRLIANFGAGTNHIDVSTAHAKGITVSNTPGVLTEDTADLTMALILAVPRRLVEGDRRLRAGEFTGWGPTHMLGHRVRGGKLGILGMGRIGQALARRATAFGLDVHYHNRRRVPKGIEDSLGVMQSACPKCARIAILSTRHAARLLTRRPWRRRLNQERFPVQGSMSMRMSPVRILISWICQM